AHRGRPIDPDEQIGAALQELEPERSVSRLLADRDRYPTLQVAGHELPVLGAVDEPPAADGGDGFAPAGVRLIVEARARRQLADVAVGAGPEMERAGAVDVGPGLEDHRRTAFG